MKASMKAQEKQAAEMSAFTNKIAALATAQGHEQGLAIGMVEGRGDNRPPRQSRPPAPQYRQTPQMRQRDNYVQNFASRQDGGGPRSFTRPAPQQHYAQQPYTPQRPQQQYMQQAPRQQMSQQPGGGCAQSGWQHEPGNCRAQGVECRRYGRTGHYGRVCRSAQQPRQRRAGGFSDGRGGTKRPGLE